MISSLCLSMIFWKSAVMPGHDGKTNRFQVVSKSLGPVGAATAVWSEIPSARAGVRRRIGVVATASAIGPAMPAQAASAGDFDDIGARWRGQWGQRHRVGVASPSKRSDKESGLFRSVHKLLP